jgi:vitamin B12 transporter
MCKLCLIAFVIYLYLSTPSLAEERHFVELDPVVITASRIEEPVSEVPASIDVITSHDIEAKQGLTVDEVLRGSSGLNINTFGGADPWAGVYLRGADRNQSLIMIDGIKINPPYSQDPAIGGLLLNNVDRIEVIKGSYSALYGSEAIGGVVNIITQERPGLTYALSGGTHTTYHDRVSYGGRYNETAYTLGYERLSAEGFQFSGPYWNNSLQGKLSLPITPNSLLQLSTYYWEWKKYDHTVCCEIDTSFNIFFVLDKDSNVREDNWLNSIQLSQYPSDQWDYSIRLSSYSTNLHSENSLDPATADRPFPLEIDSDIQSDRDAFEMQHNFHYSGNNVLSLGLQYTGERVRKKEFGNLDFPPGMGPSSAQPDVNGKRISKAIYLQDLFKIKKQFSLTAGARFENGPGFENKLIPKVSALYHFPSSHTTMNASYGLGIRAPSLKELYHPVGGNPDLEPEKSVSLEAGIKQSFLDERVGLEVTGFKLRLKDLIDWSSDPSVITYVNIGRAEITGAEAALRWAITEKLHSRIGYTRLVTENEDTGEDLAFRPDYRWTLEAIYQPVRRLTLDLNAEFVGESFNPHDFLIGLDGNALSDTAASHRIVNMAAAYRVADRDPLLGALDFTLKLNNIFDEEYTEIPGFPSDGFTFLAGIRAVR